MSQVAGRYGYVMAAFQVNTPFPKSVRGLSAQCLILGYEGRLSRRYLVRSLIILPLI